MGRSKHIIRWLKKRLGFRRRGNRGYESYDQEMEPDSPNMSPLPGTPDLKDISDSFSEVSIGTYLTSPPSLPPEELAILRGDGVSTAHSNALEGEMPSLVAQIDFSVLECDGTDLTCLLAPLGEARSLDFSILDIPMTFPELDINEMTQNME